MSTKSGISRSNAECPACHVGMRFTSLLRDWTPETYADWVFAYRRSGFFQKINFQAWRAKLATIGWAADFWARYNGLKAEATDDDGESYADRMNRMGEEEARKWTEAGEDPNNPDGYPSYPEY